MLDTLTSTPTRDIISVSDLNRKARQLLETHLNLLWVEGELSNVATPSSGHWYFTLKDKSAQVRCAMFKTRNTGVRFKPEQGQQVVVRGRVSLYEGRGDFQLLVEHMEEAGFGVLQRAFEALKNKLSKEGLFDEEHKQDIPELPSHLAVITSPTGAAIHDVLHVLKRRFPSIPVTVLPVQVQGEGAAAQIVKAIKLANQLKRFDVILLTRGGGSLEDLWSFNEETVARAIFASEVPIVCAVGHEVDFTIADFVADQRAPTPSAAAELLSPDQREWLQIFAGYAMLLGQHMQRSIDHNRHVLNNFSARLRHPRDRLQNNVQHLDQLELRLNRAVLVQLNQFKNRLTAAQLRHQHQHPIPLLRQSQANLQQLQARLGRQVKQLLGDKAKTLKQWMNLLNTVSPLKTLERGYSITRRQDGSVVRSSTSVKTGELIITKVAAGEFVSRVEDRH
jgi:exodeoxyribonuclease VII large subunit